MAFLVVLVLVLVAAVVIGVPVLLVWAHRREQARQAELTVAAAQLGWQHGWSPPKVLRDRFTVRNSPFGPGLPSGESITGTHRGLPLVAFRAQVSQQVHDAQSTIDFVVLALPLRAPAPELTLVQRRAGQGLLRLFGTRRQPTGDPAFDAAFFVECQVPEFVPHLLNPRLRHWLLHHPHAREVSLRWGPGDLVVWWPGRFELPAVRWLAEYAGELMCLADPS
ncbi:hypothetical protein [Crossiella cryophila]|uniref:Uncharacterized protein n=1 Tax=Crossiella cryophila TaxID=43355 RepID=A0A7W7FRU7_9PSEU|nr:hypothetical protein [Crossiella cryophila]MBB4674738.1 hypothetical protein [Crossiella cryophila]